MKAELRTILNMKNFFNIVQSTEQNINFGLRKPSRMLTKNIYTNWLHFLLNKTHKNMPVFVNKSIKNLSNQSMPFGFIEGTKLNYEQTIMEHRFCDFAPEYKSRLEFNLVVSQKDIMQYFIQWQRYRKYWWSSITTTPSLFAITDIKYENTGANVDIVARFPCGEHPVESITITNDGNEPRSHLRCTMTLEGALFVLLMDGLTNNTKEEYLRLHRKMAPFKIAFALNFEDSKQMNTLRELATLLYQKLEARKISSWLPTFTLLLDAQIKENLQMGVTYTAVLDEGTLENGIFGLLNSSTMLKEQVHVADFISYAALLFSAK